MARVSVPNNFGDNVNPQNIPKRGKNEQLVTWLTERVKHARVTRNNLHEGRWDEYTRLWRGIWDEQDKNRSSERSRLITPALSQAIESTVSEMEEATFGRTAWVDIDDDIADQQKQDAVILRDQLLEDFKLAKVSREVKKVYLLGAVYGTGIAKVNVRLEKEPGVQRDDQNKLIPATGERVRVYVEAIRPDEFLIDPSAKNVDDALFCAHEFIKPLHTIKEKQDSGMYNPGAVHEYKGHLPDSKTDGRVQQDRINYRDRVLITEYYGKVPSHMIPGAKRVKAGKVEAIVTLANEQVILKAVENPFVLQDRPIIAYQHDTIPGQFWGRGVSEKGYNPAKALDAEFRARQDGLGLLTHPIFGADITRMPRRTDFRIRPGKVFHTRGEPNSIIQRIDLGDISPATFQHTGDLERWVQAGTGAMDSATPLSTNRRNETSGGMAQIGGGAVRRSKRAMRNVDEDFMEPLVRKCLWRYMQFEPSLYPTDFKFIINSGMGIMAKEFEVSQLTQLLGFLNPDTPEFKIVLKAIFDMSSSAGKKELAKAMEVATRPPSQEEQQQAEQARQLNLENAALENDLLRAKILDFKTRAGLAVAKTEHERVETDLEDDLVRIQAANAVTGAEKARVTRKQTEVAEERNDIERLKIKKGLTSGGSNTRTK